MGINRKSKTIITMKTFKELEEKVIEWGEVRGLYDSIHGANADTQYIKFVTEMGELAEAYTAHTQGKETMLNKKGVEVNVIKELKDAIGDSIVCLIARLRFEDGLDQTKYFTKDMLDNYLKDFDHISVIEIIAMTLETARQQTSSSIAFLLILEHRLGFNFLECLNQAYEEIKDRKGKMINGTFVKE